MTAIVGYPDNYVMSTVRHPMQHLAADRCASAGWRNGAASGVELENYYYSAKAHAVLVERLARRRPCSTRPRW